MDVAEINSTLAEQGKEPLKGPPYHVFEDKPDARQADTAIAVSRFRPRYRALSEEEKSVHDEIKTRAQDLEQSFEKVRNGRYKSLALTALEESVMWVVKELTA